MQKVIKIKTPKGEAIIETDQVVGAIESLWDNTIVSRIMMSGGHWITAIEPLNDIADKIWGPRS